MSKSVLFLVPYPHDQAPSQRFRFEQYLPILTEKGYKYTIHSFYSQKTWTILHQEGHVFVKTLRIAAAFFTRFSQLFSLSKYDVVFIHREAAPIGPPIFEWIITKIARKKVIYDFDDAIWLPNYSEANSFFQKLKYYSKVNKIIKWSHTISTGNAYLADYSKKYNSNVVINPTTIDTENYHNPSLFSSVQKNHKTVIGWTGTLTTAKYLSFLTPILEKLSHEFDFEFCVISNEKPAIQLKNLVYVQWKKETEIQDLMRFDIGVMPLTDDQWSKGKCGFKALQYMALGIPSIASPVGINMEIIDNGLNGFLCKTELDWYNALHYFLADSENRKKMHEEARKKIVTNYSVISNTRNFMHLFED